MVSPVPVPLPPGGVAVWVLFIRVRVVGLAHRELLPGVGVV